MLLEYDGSAYAGWQIQPNGPSVQGELEQALSRISGDRVKVIGAGRTDAGVHALGQVAAFRTGSRLEPGVLMRALNAGTPSDIRVLALERAPDDFHPRFSAKGKRYVYFIQNQPFSSVFLGPWAWRVPAHLDLSAMRKALSGLIGRHDFSCFRASGCASKSPIRTISKAEVELIDNPDFFGFKLDVPLIRILVEGDGFLRHMVRNIAGLAVEVGRGRTAPGDVDAIRRSGDRRLSGPTAPAHGLFLESVIYMSPIFKKWRS